MDHQTMIKRYYDIQKLTQKGKALIIYGPRRSGKTTLLVDFLKHTKLKYKLDSGDNIQLQELLASDDVQRILEYAEGYDLIEHRRIQVILATECCLRSPVYISVLCASKNQPEE